MKKKSAWGLLKQTGSEFMEDKVLRHSAALAYYAIFSIGPLLVLVVGIAGLVLGQERVQKEVIEGLKGALGAGSAEMVQSMMTSRDEGRSLLATIIGGAALLLGASGVFGQLQDSLNTIWEVRAKPGQGIWGFIRQRFLSMTMVLGIGFLLLISMVLTVVLNALAGYIGGAIGLSETLAHILNFLVSFGVITVLFALIFKLLPDVEIRWRHVWVGAVGTALLFTLGKYLLGWYLGREGTTSAFGAGAAFVIIVMYVYYASLILFFGAEFTQVYARSTGDIIEPSAHAEKITEDQRAQEGAPRDRSKEQGRRAKDGRRQGAGVYHPVPAFQGGSSMTFESNPHEQLAPLEQIRARPWSFVLLAAGAGLAAGAFFKVRTARRMFELYSFARRFM